MHIPQHENTKEPYLRHGQNLKKTNSASVNSRHGGQSRDGLWGVCSASWSFKSALV
jgi:hypothetical protein